jgi:hypothetical protein
LVLAGAELREPRPSKVFWVAYSKSCWQKNVGQLPPWLGLRAVLREQGVNKLLLVRPPLWFWLGADLREQCEKQGLLISSLRGDGFVPNCGNSVLTESGLLFLFVVLAEAELPEGFLHQP